MSKVLVEKILSNEKVAPNLFKMSILSEYIAQNALPGQFLNIKCGEGLNNLLRRPISIMDIDKEKNIVYIAYQVKGTGTNYLSYMKENDLIDIVGPLGKGFYIDEKIKSAAFVGGGIGTFPLLYLMKEMNFSEKKSFLGFRSKDFVVFEDDFNQASQNVYISTDDGSYKNSGLVTIGLIESLKIKKPDIIYTCGPTPMIKSVVDIANEYGVRCQVSLEQRMGCGIGACLVCACKTKSENSDFKYSHVCKDGPVFWSSEVIFE